MTLNQVLKKLKQRIFGKDQELAEAAAKSIFNDGLSFHEKSLIDRAVEEAAKERMEELESFKKENKIEKTKPKNVCAPSTTKKSTKQTGLPKSGTRKSTTLPE